MADGYLLDTDVISETAKAEPSVAVLNWLETVTEISLSAVTLYELSRGIQSLRDGHCRRFLEAWFEKLQQSPVASVSFDGKAALAAAQIEMEARRLGRVIETHDLFILGTARVNGLPIATGNVAHFKGFGVPVLNPFQGHYR